MPNPTTTPDALRGLIAHSGATHPPPASTESAATSATSKPASALATVVETRSGALIDLAEPDPADIRVDDIAAALSHQCRFTGNVRRYFSVAGHALFCRRLIRAAGHPELSFAVLHHDDHEAFLGDVPTPAGRLLIGLGDLKHSLDVAIAAALGLTLEELHHPLVADVDRLALFLEARALQRHRGMTLGVDAPEHFDVDRFAHVRLPFSGRSRRLSRRAYLAAHHHDSRSRQR